MNFIRWIWAIVLGVALSTSAPAATLGRPVAIGGQASDLALDEGRGVLYVANQTRKQIQILSLSNYALQDAISVPDQPTGIALSPDARYLVVIYYVNFAPTATQNTSLSVIDLNSRQQKLYSLSSPPLAAAFGFDGQAVVITSTGVSRFDPSTGTSAQLETVTNIAKALLPNAKPDAIPTSVQTARLGVSGDGLIMYGVAEALAFKYDVFSKKLTPGPNLTGIPTGPSVLSVNRDGSQFAIGWQIIDSNGVFKNQFSNRFTLYNIGTTVFDDSRGLLYAQILEPGATAASAPILKIVNSENLALYDQIQLPENTAGKSVLSSDGTMFSVSDSGVLVVPMGLYARLPRLVADKQDLVYRFSFCDKGAITQVVNITDAGGGNIPFSISSTIPGVNVQPTTAFTPQQVRVTIDANVLQANKGTISGLLQIRTNSSVNVPRSIRILANSRDGDQRGWFNNVPGTLVGIVADPIRDRFYIVRSSTNEVLVFDSNTFGQIAALPTGNNPSSAAILPDGRWMLVANQDSQYFNVYDLETLQPGPVITYSNAGGQVRAIGVTVGNTIVSIVDPQGKAHIYRVDFDNRKVVLYESLGTATNDLRADTSMASDPLGASVLIAQGDGTLMVYNGYSDSFSTARKDLTSVNGPLAVSPGSQYYIAGDRLLNARLGTIFAFENVTGLPSAYAFEGGRVIRMTAPNASSPGVIQKVSIETGTLFGPTRLVEAPQIATATNPFPNTLALLPNGRYMLVLSTSGYMVIPVNYDVAIAPPQLDRVVNAADLTKPIAPKGLISLFGSNLSPVSIGTGEISPSAAIQQSCLQVNGASVPVLYVSNSQINAQLPNLDGNTTLKLITPGGTSDTFRLTIQPTAPSVFRISSAPAVYRASTNELVGSANPVRVGDVLSIYATGLGRTTPDLELGEPAPFNQLATADITPQVSIGGSPLDLLFAGLVPGQVGVYQINVRVNGSVAPAENAVLEIKQGAAATSWPVRVVQ